MFWRIEVRKINFNGTQELLPRESDTVVVNQKRIKTTLLLWVKPWARVDPAASCHQERLIRIYAPCPSIKKSVTWSNGRPQKNKCSPESEVERILLKSEITWSWLRPAECACASHSTAMLNYDTHWITHHMFRHKLSICLQMKSVVYIIIISR